MGEPKKHRKHLRTVGLVVLALACIAGVELAVCRFAEPELFHRITAPVVELAQDAWQQGRELIEGLQQAVAADSTPEREEEPLVNQKIQEPVEEETDLVQDPKVTQFDHRGDQEVLTGGVIELVYFNQGEEPWADALYGRDPISGYGCGPTAMSMVVSSLSGQVVDPAQMAEIASQEGYWAPSSGSYLSIVQGLGQQFGLEAQSCGEITADDLCRRLASGELLVALMGPGHFTSGGHFIVLRGVSLTGEILVADPNSRDRSLALWDPQLILDELSASRTNGAPLWCFSTLGD